MLKMYSKRYGLVEYFRNDPGHLTNVSNTYVYEHHWALNVNRLKRTCVDIESGGLSAATRIIIIHVYVYGSKFVTCDQRFSPLIKR